MSLNFTPSMETIETNGGSVTVRGLSFDDLHILIQRGHGEALAPLLSGDLNIDDLLSTAPTLVADLITLAADEPDAAPTIAQMPIGIQTRVLAAVYRLTFGEFEWGNVLRRLAETVLTAKSAIRENSHI